MSEEKAATEKLRTRKHKPYRKYPIEIIQKAESNGISANTFRKRVQIGWSTKDASTIPLFSRSQKKMVIRDRYGMPTRKTRKPYEEGKGFRVQDLREGVMA